jgi:hypothetical protein
MTKFLVTGLVIVAAASLDAILHRGWCWRAARFSPRLIPRCHNEALRSMEAKLADSASSTTRAIKESA